MQADAGTKEGSVHPCRQTLAGTLQLVQQNRSPGLCSSSEHLPDNKQGQESLLRVSRKLTDVCAPVRQSEEAFSLC